MRHLVRATAVIATILGTWAPTAQSQSIKGVVLEDSTSVPIEAAQVSLLNDRGEDLAITIRTGPTGAFTLHAPRPGPYRVRAIRIGYQPATSEVIRLGFGEVVTVRLRMTVATQRLAPVAVTERRRYNPTELTTTVGFDLRRQQPYGVFFTGEELDRLYDVNSIARTARIGGLVLSGAGTIDERLAFRRSTGNECYPALYLDGIKVGQDLVNNFSPDLLYGIEVYRPRNPPPIGTAGWLEASCGLVAVWSKLQLTRDSLAGLLPGTTRPGVQVIRGTVVDPHTGKPLAGVPVRLLSEHLYPLPERTRSDSAGEFVVRTDRIGPLRLEFGGDSSRPVATPVVKLAAEELLIVQLLSAATRPVASALGIAVRAGPNSYKITDVRGFAYRRARGVTGIYFDTDALERRSPRTLAELLGGVEGITITGAPPADTIAMRRPLPPPADRCAPIYLRDGARLPPTRSDSIVRALRMSDVVAVEVHPDPLRAPAIFDDVIGACGLIGIWTGTR